MIQRMEKKIIESKAIYYEKEKIKDGYGKVVELTVSMNIKGT